jgi:hypothetical protein
MKRANGFFLFLLIFLLLTAAVFLINYICFRDFFIENTPQAILLFSVSQATLTHFSDQSIGESSSWFQLFSILSTQAAGLMFYTMLLWLFHQLFSEKKAEHYSLKKAFTTTLLVSAICELALFAFFLYGIPAALTDGDFSQKILAALTLAVNSFNNAGFSLGSLFFETGIVANNFMIQIGIIGGALAGRLGHFCAHRFVFTCQVAAATARPRHRLELYDKAVIVWWCWHVGWIFNAFSLYSKINIV